MKKHDLSSLPEEILEEICVHASREIQVEVISSKLYNLDGFVRKHNMIATTFKFTLVFEKVDKPSLEITITRNIAPAFMKTEAWKNSLQERKECAFSDTKPEYFHVKRVSAVRLGKQGQRKMKVLVMDSTNIKGRNSVKTSPWWAHYALQDPKVIETLRQELLSLNVELIDEVDGNRNRFLVNGL